MKQSVSIVLSGEAGQGLQTIEEFLVKSINPFYHVYSTKEVMSRIRGGNNSVEIRVASEPVYAFRQTIDYLFLLNNNAFTRMETRVVKGTHVFGEPAFLSDEQKDKLKDKGAIFHDFLLSDLASSAGSVIFSNTILYGFISGMLSLAPAACHTFIESRFSYKGESIVSKNQVAFDLGYGEGSKHAIKLDFVDFKAPLKILDGNEAICIGALAGGCNFVAAYPMSPGTAVLTYMADKGLEYNIFVEQAEDEIAAMNMVIGAWYAGARALTTTSGGGFALMEEAVSLSGITETPCVIHIAQRPGPATGLPTRTEQGDLNLAVYAGHGEFPRIVLAPGNLADGLLLSQKAFYLADRYQVPVFILSDQYYLDTVSQLQVSDVHLNPDYLDNHIVETSKDYKRYAFNAEGLSPRGIPGFGEGFVRCDSDEHTEDGFITENPELRVQMNTKRLNKESLLLADYCPPELIGPKNYQKLIVGWGSTYGVIKEFVETTDLVDVAFLHIKQVYPLSPSLKSYFAQATKIVDVEVNATGQLASLLKLHLDVQVDEKLLRFDGDPFSIEGLELALKEVLA